MAGVVAMASVIEDFDTQPCKKNCKDVDNPVVKTITNYFSPVAKAAEKTFSPPRSNNIMDYFNRKGPSPKNRLPSPKQPKENCQAEKNSSPPSVPKQSAHKRSKKPSKTARKLVETTTLSSDDSSCFVVEVPDSPAKVTKTCGVLGSDTAILLGQICAEASASTERSESKSGESDQHKKTLLARSDQQCINLSPVLPSKDKAKKVKTAARNAKKMKLQEEKLPDPEGEEMKKSLCDNSMEVNVDDASQLNNSTVTISFEDFVRSHDLDTSNNELCKESETVAENEQLQILDAKENLGESFVQISPRTVTIQAEVHAISPKEEGKVASIFTRGKGSSSVQGTSPQTEAGVQMQPALSMWKSNVVLQEKDVELYVLESSSTPKCSQAERKQFMAAFKQPSDGAKIKPKSQGKQKQTGDETEATDNVREKDPAVQSSSVHEKSTATSQDSEVVTKKPARKRQKLAKEEKDTNSSPAAVLEEETEVIDVDKKNKQATTTSSSSVPVVRRSRRVAVVRQTQTTVAESHPKNISKQDSSKDTAALTQDLSAEVSIPQKRKPKHGVFKSEMMCPSDTGESPIRIRFTRVSKRRNKEKNGHTVSTPLVAKNIKESKKTKQAKKLLEKAKAMKHNKKVSTEEKTPRRSSRTEAIKRSYCEDEDSIICVEESLPTTPQPVAEKCKSKKALRSLNEVLGKAAPNKESKTAPGLKDCQEKPSQKPPLVVSIFDDSSREGSENSQDSEQFRARREFLKSGLPETFRKQMAKTAAAKEAYAATCSTFQPSIHVNQPPNDCPFWSLPWPESSFLHHLKGIWCQFSNPSLLNSGVINFNTEPVHRSLLEKSFSLRPAMSTCARELLMKEISCSNPDFPVQKFMGHFLKRRADLHQCTAFELKPVSTVSFSELPPETTGGKRKRTDGGETVKIAKKQRSSRSGENLITPTAEKEPVRRTRRQTTVRKKDEIKSETSQRADLVHSTDNAVVILDDSPLGQKSVKPDVLKEDMLWTEKYQPQHSSEVIGNTASVRRLYSWLKEWKLRAGKEDIKKKKDKKQEEGSIDSDWECSEENSQDGEDMLCNTMLIRGPTGVGKTAAVYACAQELGFKVFEVNASSQRSGRLILSQLREATQSHQVDSKGVSAHKPTYFNSYSTSTVRPGSSPRKVSSPRRAVSSPRKAPMSPRAAKRGGLAPTTLANFFKMSKPGNKKLPNTKEEQTAVSKKKSKEGNNKSTPINSPTDSLEKDTNTEEQSKKTATSLILFEEVDIIFDDDTGFLSAIKTFMTTTKRPVILTTSDPAFSAMFDGNFEEIIFETPSVLNVSSYLQLLCLAEDMRVDLKDISSLLRLYACDIRKTLLQLQFWIRSGGGLQQKTEYKDENIAEIKDLDLLPVCDSGCTESMLGLLNIEPQRNIWELLKTQSQMADCSKIVTLSRRQGLDLLYSNMERLLPLPITTLTIAVQNQQSLLSPLDQPSVNLPRSQKLSSHTILLHTGDVFSDDASPVKVSNRMKKNKRHCLPEQRALQSDSDSEDEFISISRKNAPKKKDNVKLVPVKVIRKPLSHEEQIKSVPVSQCLQSLSDFLDDLSLIDLFGSEDSNISERTCGGVVVKDGLIDESRIETEKRSLMMIECASEIHAALQSLSFNKCRLSVRNAWETVQQLDGGLKEEAAAELSLPVTSHNECYTFTQHGPCQPVVVQRRAELIDELMLKGAFGFMGNRSAAAQDYLPALRTVCRSERLKEQGKVKRRFLHYLDGIHLGLQQCTLQHLAEDFP